MWNVVCTTLTGQFGHKVLENVNRTEAKAHIKRMTEVCKRRGYTVVVECDTALVVTYEFGKGEGSVYKIEAK